MWSRLFRAGAALGVAILLGRIAGLAREVFLARELGVSPTADGAVVLLTVPDLLVNLLISSAFAAVLIPEFKRMSPDRAFALFCQASLVSGFAFAVIWLALALMGEPFVRFMAPGISAPVAAETARVLTIALAALPITALSGTTAAFLNAHERFFWAAIGTFVFNCAIVIALLLGEKGDGVLLSLAIGIVLGSVIRWVAQLANIPHRARTFAAVRVPQISRAMLVKYSQAMFAGAALIVTPALARALASLEEPGTLAAFNYAYVLVSFPLGVSVTVLASVVFPRLSELLGGGPLLDKEGVALLAEAVRATSLIAVGLAVSCSTFSEPLAAVVFGYGQLRSGGTERIAQLAMCGFALLPFYGLNAMMVAAFNARGDTRTPMRMNLGGLLMLLPLGWISSSIAGALGVMISLVLSHALVSVALIVGLRREFGHAPFALLAKREFAVACGAGVLGVLACAAAAHHFPGTRWHGLAWMVLSATAFFAVALFLIGDYRSALVKYLKRAIAR